MGAVFAVPVGACGAVEELPGRDGGARGARRPAAVGRAAEAVTLVVGAEREGLPADVVAACDAVAHIPIGSESLNAAMAATVALYEATRRPADAVSPPRRRGAINRVARP